MEMNKTLASSGGRITVIDALRGFSLIGICLIHGMQHFGAMGTMGSPSHGSLGKGRWMRFFGGLLITWCSASSSLYFLACLV